MVRMTKKLKIKKVFRKLLGTILVNSFSAARRSSENQYVDFR